MVRFSIPTLFAALALVGLAALPAPASPAVGTRAPDFDLPTLAGERVKLSKLLSKGPVVLVVLRGYPGRQCPICSRQVGDFLGKADRFKKAGARVVFVYPGAGKKLQAKAKEFVRGKHLPRHFYLCLDTDYTLVNAYKLRWKAKNETSHPATFVIGRKGKVRFAKVSKDHGHRARATEVLAVLDREAKKPKK